MTTSVTDNARGGRTERWFQGMHVHRLGAPAMVTYNADGTVQDEKWFFLDNLHRVDGPAWTHYRDGWVESAVYHQGGKRHRVDGPADLSFDEHGSVTGAGFYLDGMLRHSVERFASALDTWTIARLRAEFGRSSYRELFRSKVPPRRIVEIIGQGVTSVEGIRAVHGGAPVEWAIAFEAARTADDLLP